MFNDGWERHDARAAARIGAVIGVPARANMLAALAGGQALTATELALHAGVTAQTASSHLKKMTDLHLISVEMQGRHRYFRLADARIADALEPLAHLLPDQPVAHRKPSKILMELRESRMCYDHLAGVLGVAVADALAAVAGLAMGEAAEGMPVVHVRGLDISGPLSDGQSLIRPPNEDLFR